ncbi:MAG: NAD(P)-dependent oxidoreductase [Candidatus Hermodarchaeota archaeon]
MNDSNELVSDSVRIVRVCFISNIPENAKEYIIGKLKSFDNIELNFKEETKEENFFKIIPKADILIGWRPSKSLLLKATNLKLFINPGAGIHHLIDLFREINKMRKVYLINGHGNSYFVAQHTIALLLALMNKIIPHHEWMREGRWRTGDDDAVSIPLRYKKVGLFGYGAINRKVHRFLSGFDIEFCILRKDWKKQKESFSTNVTRYEFSQLHQFLKNIDILIIAVPITSLTKNIIGKDELDLLGSKGLLVNVSRGEIIEEESLFIALKEKIIQGAAIDVWYNYTPEENEEGKKFPFNFPFHFLDNIVLSPHRGYSPFNDLLRWDEIIENITRMSQGRQDFLNVVNLEEEY